MQIQLKLIILMNRSHRKEKIFMKKVADYRINKMLILSDT
jgi:hypothetical protein